MAGPNRKNVEIDESVIHDMMEGDIPAFSRSAMEDKGKPGTLDSDPSGTLVAGKVRKKRESKDYSSIYLVKRASEQRKHSYVSIELWDKIATVLPVIAPGVSIPMFIDNVLSHHLETYRDEINELYMGKLKPL